MLTHEQKAKFVKVVTDSVPEKYRKDIQVDPRQDLIYLKHPLGGKGKSSTVLTTLTLWAQDGGVRITTSRHWKLDLNTSTYRSLNSKSLIRRIKTMYKKADELHEQELVQQGIDAAKGEQLRQTELVRLKAEYGDHFKVTGPLNITLNIGGKSFNVDYIKDVIRLDPWGHLQIPLDLAVELLQQMALRSMLED